jgi:hypothetical protein
VVSASHPPQAVEKWTHLLDGPWTIFSFPLLHFITIVSVSL